MPLSRAVLHRFELPSALLERGFWLYVWKVQQGHNTRPLFYVGMTGDTGSYSAQSPLNRVSGHLGSNEHANALRQYAVKKGVNLDSCWKIELAAYGPISTVPVITDDLSRDLLRAPGDRDRPFRLIATPVTIDRDHRFRAIATSLWTEITGAVG